jgi:hypothetical protein
MPLQDRTGFQRRMPAKAGHVCNGGSWREKDGKGTPPAAAKPLKAGSGVELSTGRWLQPKKRSIVFVREPTKMTQYAVAGRHGQARLAGDFFASALADGTEFAGLSAPGPEQDHDMLGSASRAEALHGPVLTHGFKIILFIGKSLHTLAQTKLTGFHPYLSFLVSPATS